MRSDKNKKTDPKREIDDFLSRFDSSMDGNPKDFNTYQKEDASSSSENEKYFTWKDVKSSGSDSRNPSKDNSKRKVVKDPAPSAIKVERKKAEPDTVHTFSAEEITKMRDDRPQPVAPKKASDVVKAAQPSAEEVIDEFFGNSDDLLDETLFAESSSSAKEKTIVATSTETDNCEKNALNSEAAEIKVIEESKLEAVDETGSKSEQETESEYEEEEKHVIQEATETEPHLTVPSDLTAKAQISRGIDLSNNTNYIPDYPSNEYILDSDGNYYRVDLGKKSKYEYIDVPEGKSENLAIFAAGKKKSYVADAESQGSTGKQKKSKRTLKQRLFLKKNKKYDPSKGPTYVVEGRTVKNKEFKFSFLKLVRNFVIICLIVAIIGVGLLVRFFSKAPEHDYSDIYATVATASVVYDDQGKQIDNIFYTENRRIVKYSDMPESLIEAVVAIEDKTFWKHHGFNWVRMIGAVLSSITGNGQISGTSTITQQLARNIYLPEKKSERSIERKLLEMYYAARLERALSKEEIIEAYLNTIYLGYGCYGVNSASRTYFSKNVKDLSVVECAAIAALPQMPHTYALLKNASEGGEVSEDSKVVAKSPQKVITNDLSKDRRDLTLDLMLEQGLITEAEYKESYNVPLNDFINPYISSPTSIYTYFHDYLVDTLVADLVEEKDLTLEDAERLVYTGGLQIYSTINTEAQQVIVDEFKDDNNFPGISALWKRDYNDNILNNDGNIALYDYDDYFDEDGNFTLSGENEDIVFHSDGSATINSGHNLYIYETDVNGETDYSLEFKNYYVLNDGVLYSIQGGFINIPQSYKSGDGNGNVKISADFFKDDNYRNSFKKDGDDLIITDTGYSLAQQVRQPQGAMVIAEVGTGQIKAMAGGRQFTGQRLLNRATNTRQPGSSIKPLAVYGAALQKSYELAAEGKKWTYTDFKIDKQGTKGWGDYVTVHSSIEDERTKIEGKYWPKNSNNAFTGKNNFKTAIQQSINTCAVKLEMQIGNDYSLQQVKKFGITTLVNSEDNPEVNDVNTAALALGAMTYGVTPLEMSLAYAAFPGGGKVNTPVCYTKVLDKSGNVLIEGKSEQTEALNEGVAWIMTDVLKNVVRQGIAWPASINDVQVGGKTGTTNDQYDIWFDGFTPSYAAALWIGTDNNIEMDSMSNVAASLWSTIMDQIPMVKEGEYKDMPSNVVEKWGDYYTEGTENGLDSWSYAEMKKKARDAAYKKWQSERENHKKKVIDVKGETKTVTKTRTKEIKAEQVAEYQKKNMKVTYDSKTKKYYVEETYEEKVVIEEKWHWEYEKGWRDGDFTYKFDGQTFDD